MQLNPHPNPQGTPKQDCTGVTLHKELPNFLRCIRGASTEPLKKLISVISSCFANRFRLAFFCLNFWVPQVKGGDVLEFGGTKINIHHFGQCHTPYDLVLEIFGTPIVPVV
ncbi:MAG: hypothetical protein B7Y53_05085 [Halothiobacillus sp. 28-55-5]|nr:MAG: hypothetical protein B7Y53_05085 [Halothiobacillus sp. 28-55-5]